MKLTQKECEVSVLVCSGFNDKQIADFFDIALSTVRIHMSSIRKKLNVNNRVKIVNKVLL